MKTSFFALLIFAANFFIGNLAIANELLQKFEITRYGSFLYSENIPNTLFFFNDIEKNDSFQLRKAMRNHDIHTVVLASRGGEVWEGLQMAGIIHDKGLTTYVPLKGIGEDGVCASACSFMFFGGKTRLAQGSLGVHQFFSAKDTQKESVSDVQKYAQFTVSEIIGFLNEFETPPFVFERMFQQSSMYYFSDTELKQINNNNEIISDGEVNKINSFITNLNIALAKALKEEEEETESVAQTPKPNETKDIEIKPVEPERLIADRKDVARLVQTELNRIGCNLGSVDGVIGPASKQALKLFNHKAKTSHDSLQFFYNPDSIDYLKKFSQNFCPKKVKSKKLASPKKEIWKGWEYCFLIDGKMSKEIEVKKINDKEFTIWFPGQLGFNFVNYARKITFTPADGKSGYFNFKIDSDRYKLDVDFESGVLSGTIHEGNLIARSLWATIAVSGYCTIYFQR